MTHVREVAKKLVVFLHGLVCFTDKLTTTLLGSLGHTLLALITIPLACVNQLGALTGYVGHLVLDTAVTLLAFVVLPILRRIYNALAAVFGFFFTGRAEMDQEERWEAKSNF